ncbi:BamA/TamA family outer membrane protein [Kamptonema sp. UHCC 0994]|uniref:BamA/TamA family outer membrane protein n=1 Tax=Kamptonema sp. UHCC 0994 TaxID=3031329 RepID=UPI0023BAB98E|nr:BamA/TamA family outer membrane protein [Kamptonema sp. UHCC 0994]MDF0556723.1 BamA/TamA family outer membrane protein [Kamptonema sp. UHCC 0994]
MENFVVSDKGENNDIFLLEKSPSKPENTIGWIEESKTKLARDSTKISQSNQEQKLTKNSETYQFKQSETTSNRGLENTTSPKRNPALDGTPVGYVPHSPRDIAQAPSPSDNPAPESPTPPVEIPAPTLEAPQAPPIPRTTPAPPTGQSDSQVLVAEVVVSGVEGELEDQVYRVISTQPGRTTTRAQLQQDINAIFATGFFRNVRAVPEDTPLGVRVTFIVQANPILRGVTITGQQVLPQSAIDEAFRDQYGKILNLRQFEEGVKKINKWYQDNGYVLGQVTDAPQVSDDGNVTLQVAEGIVEAVEVRFLNKEGEATDAKGQPIKGNTREFIITREVELKPGEVFNRNKAERDLRRVFGLGIFEDVRLALEPGATDPRKARVIVNVIEKNTGSLAAGAGLSSATGLFGTISYQEQNLGGNNQRLGAELQIGERATLFDVSFTDPWIAGDPYRTSYTVNAFRRRSISVIFDGGDNEVRLPNGDRPRILRTGGGLSFTRPLERNPFADSEWVASVGFQYQRVSIRDRNGNVRSRDEDGNKLSFSNSGSDDLLTLQAGVVRDRRNDPLRPTSGSVLRFGMEQSVPVGSGAILFNRIRGSYSYYLPVRYTRFATGPQTLAFNVQAGTILGDLPPYEAFALGGANSVRGYDEGDVGAGRSFIQATAEYRFPIISFVGGALFVDAASDLGTGGSVPGDPAGVRGKPGSGVGAGFGVRIQSPLGPIRIDYGFNVDGGSRLHFGIGERF